MTDINTTRDGVHVVPGQLWEDLDKRVKGRTVRVSSVSDGKATVQSPSGGTVTRISIRRMHKHSTGFRLVQDVRPQTRDLEPTESDTTS